MYYATNFIFNPSKLIKVQEDNFESLILLFFSLSHLTCACSSLPLSPLCLSLPLLTAVTAFLLILTSAV